MEMAVVAEHGGAVEAVPYMKAALVDSHRERLRRIESGEQVVVGQNRFTETEDSPLTADAEGGILVVDPALEAEQVEAVQRWRAERDQAAVEAALAALAAAAAAAPGEAENLMVADDRGRARGRDHRASGRRRCATCSAATALPPAWARPPRHPPTPTSASCARRSRACRSSSAAGPKILVGKPGLDGHSNGAEQIAVRARDSGMDVVYEGIRLTPAQIAASALQEGVHVIGLSILSGSHRELIPAVHRRAARVRRGGAGGGRRDHPRAGRRRCCASAGVSAVYTPKDFDITRIMREILALVGAGADGSSLAATGSGANSSA